MASLLVVDDDPDVLDALCAMLAGMGHTVERATGGLPALEIIEGKPVDLLMTDVVMPGLHGFNLARMAVLRCPTLKVLYFTGYTDVTISQDEGQKFGKLLTKPLRHDDVPPHAAEPLPADGTRTAP